ncbi:CAP domain-containing protein [Qingshengfaniella alkalisoli]|uniref:CAP domain-containing protein n=1 Tax=Qingshengfaniella alkalisoli TaxID=2599296 RepID=A0A5B8J0M0_9RHOB|nr:CAP domain-containing protein [Qingshengfaniella alkalisoli]QDY71444.1 CAP domain-containing protein [Qingshengfaniella alkalisoli]
MLRTTSLMVLSAAILSACAPAGSQIPTRAADGIYHIDSEDAEEIRARSLEAVNFMRANRGAAPVAINPALNAAAQIHANDMSRQHRAWPFGADGSTPYDRVQRAGYTGELIGEVYSQSYETELETLQEWIQNGDWGPELVNPEATEMGFAWHQDNDGLIWWAITMGRDGYTGTTLASQGEM